MYVKNNMDFSVFIRDDIGSERTGGKRSLLYLPLVAAALLVLTLWLAFSLLEKNADRRLALIGASISGTTVSLEHSGAQSGSVVDDIIAVERVYSEEHSLTTDVLNAVMKAQPEDLEILALRYSANEITLDCRSKRELCGADFAQLLRISPQFSHIGYNGVVSVDGGYGFTITAQLGGEGE